MTFVKKDNLEYLEASSQEQETCLTLQEHDGDDDFVFIELLFMKN